MLEVTAVIAYYSSCIEILHAVRGAHIENQPVSSKACLRCAHTQDKEAVGPTLTGGSHQ